MPKTKNPAGGNGGAGKKGQPQAQESKYKENRKMQEETKKKLNVLTGMQTHKLYAWVEGGEGRDFSKEFLPWHAMGATESLGFTVTPENIITATKDLGYIKPKPKAVAAPLPAAAPAYNIDITAALKILTENNATLARAIIHLSNVIGVTPENGLAVIAGTGIKKSSDSLFNL